MNTHPAPTPDAFDAWMVDQGLPATTHIDGAEVVTSDAFDVTGTPRPCPAIYHGARSVGRCTCPESDAR